MFEKKIVYRILIKKILSCILGLNFTQRDIDLRHIQYAHTGVGGVRDLIKLDVTDGLNPLIDRYFYVTIEGLDMIYPRVSCFLLICPFFLLIFRRNIQN
jgi:hypothetical protein